MVVLATKVYVDGEARDRALDGLETLVADALADLDVESTIGLRDDGFPSVTVTGADATAARNLLAAEWGAVTPHREPGETHVGTLASWDDEGFVLDAGEDAMGHVRARRRAVPTGGGDRPRRAGPVRRCPPGRRRSARGGRAARR